MSTVSLALAIALAVAGVSTGRADTEANSPGDAELHAALDAIRARPAFRTSTFGVLITHVKSGRVLLEHNAEKLLTPASTVKVITAAGALATLGPDFRFETSVVSAGRITDGSLTGDLVLVGAGDPNLSQRPRGRHRLAFVDDDHSYAGFSRGEVVPGDPLQTLRSLARETHRAGVRCVEGNVVVDDGLFEDRFDPFVGAVSAVCVNDNLVDVFVTPARKPGERATVECQPLSPTVTVECAARTVPEGGDTRLWLERLPGVASWKLLGTIAQDAGRTLRVAALERPGLAAAHFLREALEAEGITVKGEARVARLGPAVYASYPVLTKHVSPPLSETVRVMMKVSQNVHATMLPLVIGARLGGRGTATEGLRQIARAFEPEQVGLNDVVVTSGSGGGRADRISPIWMVTLLRHLRGLPYFDPFYQSLPVGGDDGTLARKMKRETLEGRVRAKTGTLVYRSLLGESWVYLTKSLAGYIDLRTAARPHELWAFSIVITDTLAKERRKTVTALFRAQEDILEAAVKAIGE